jgi:hypothetical protein
MKSEHDHPKEKANSAAPADFDMRSKLWDMTNYITGFAVAQGIYFGVQFGSSLEMQTSITNWGHGGQIFLVCVTAGMTLLYCLAVDRCHRILSKRVPQERAIFRMVKFGQWAVIILSGILPLIPLGYSIRGATTQP